jgi:nucleoside-diphosphate-sugar epimerase
MRVFITGATGFIGTALISELLAHQHEVVGMARSAVGAHALETKGAQAVRGTLEDLDSLRAGARDADAVIHLAFIHDFSRFEENCAIDRRAIETLGSVLAGSDRPLLVTAGTAGIAPSGELATEEHRVPADSHFPRVSEQTALALADVSAAVVRLPQVHDTVKQGLVSYAIAVAQEKAVSAYVGDGSNRWPAVHVLDAARLYRLALERHERGAVYHAVAEQGVRLRDIAAAIAQGLKVPLTSLSAGEALKHFGWLSMFAGYDCPASSAITQKKLGWQARGPSLLADLQGMTYR